MVPAVAEKKVSVKKATKRRFKIWLMFIVLFMGWAGYTLFGQYQQQIETSNKLSALQKQVEAAIAESEALQKHIERLNDPEYIAQLATKEQGMVKEGEQQIFSD